jgi:transcriptional regulator with XRE-family HTH domain
VTGVAVVSSPTVRRRELGAVLRRLRTEAGLTVEQVTEELLCSPSKVSRLETGQRGASLRDVRDLCNLYRVSDPAERDRLMALAREGKEQVWWQTLDWPESLSTYIGLEVEAIAIRNFESDVVPGLLQTEGYARALTRGAVPALDEQAVEEHVRTRLRRQEILTRDAPPQFHAVIDEAAFHRLPGGPEGPALMLTQLSRTIDLSGLPHVKVQVLPFTSGPQPGSDSTFVILDFVPSEVSSTVYVETLAGNLYLERDADLHVYRQVFDRLCELALTPEETVGFLERMRLQYAK